MTQKKGYVPSKRHRRNLHISRCEICNHPLRKEIEEDYLHCNPFRHIIKCYGITSNQVIIHHARIMGLEEKRNREHWYWQFLENFDFEKGIKPEHALAAAFQLDRLQHKLQELPPGPTNIQIVYKYPDKLGLKEPEKKDEIKDERKDDRNLLPAQSSPASVPPEPEKI